MSAPTTKAAQRIGKRARCWIFDKRKTFVTGNAARFPGVPHRHCKNHFIGDVAEPVLEKGGHTKVRMLRKVRGLRDIEHKMLAAKRTQDSDPLHIHISKGRARVNRRCSRGYSPPR